jgi:hypothetical protein
MNCNSDFIGYLTHQLLKIDDLKNGAIFEDAKKIDSIFKISNHTWSEVIEVFEKNEKNATAQMVNIQDIQITQRNIQSEKVKRFIIQDKEFEPINVVEFEDGLAIYDGHHRLTALWALGKTEINVNLVKIKK